MTQNHSVHHMVCSQLTKVLAVLHIRKDVVVTADQYLVTVQAGQCGQCTSVDHNVTQMVHLVSGLDLCVPLCNHVLVHLLWSGVGSQLCDTVVASKLAHAHVTKVSITYQKYTRHVVLLYSSIALLKTISCLANASCSQG